VYIAIHITLSVFNIVDYQVPMDEEYYLREPVILTMNFVLLSIFSSATAILCGLPLIYILKKFRRLSSLTLITGATILGAVALPIEMAIAVVIIEGSVSNWGDALIWTIAIGAAAGCFTALVFRIVVGIKDGNLVED